MSARKPNLLRLTWHTPVVVMHIVGLCAAPLVWQHTKGGAMAQEDANSLAGYRWQNRVVVMMAPHEDRKGAEQHQILSAAGDGLLDRDLVVVSITDGLVAIDGVVSQHWNVEQLVQALDLPRQEFSIVLIGKDGGVKLRSGEPVDVETLFALIDSMPMRQREMRERQGKQP